MKPEQRAAKFVNPRVRPDTFKALARALRAERNAALEEAGAQAYGLLELEKSPHAYQVLAEIRALKSPAPSKRKAKL